METSWRDDNGRQGAATVVDEYLPWVEWGLEGVEGIYTNITMPLAHALSRIMDNGVLVDREKMFKLDQEYRQKIGQYEREFWDAAGSQVSYTSPMQLERFLYGELGLPVIKKTATGHAATDLKVLERFLADDSLDSNSKAVVRSLYGLKKTVKLKKDFLAGWGNSVGLLKWIQHDGRIRPNYRVDGTDSGRLSSNDPNGQNIANALDIRSLFISAPGYAFLEVDYSQLELRATAILARDAAMMESIRQDMHTATASLMFGVAPEEVNTRQRSIAKVINFRVLYGGGAWGLAFQLGISLEEAEDYLDRWFKAYSNVHRWIRRTQRTARQQGYLDNPYGRRRRLPLLLLNDHRLKKVQSHLLRTAVNFSVQSTGSDSLSLATINLVLHNKRLQKMGAIPILSLHDALFFEVPERHAIDAAIEVQHVMQTVPKLVLGEEWDLPADAKIGYHWGDKSIGVVKGGEAILRNAA